MAKKTKTHAQLDREIRQALISPSRARASHLDKPAASPLERFKADTERFRADRRARHGEVLRAIRAAPVAIIMTARDGRETLAIVTREMSNPSEGPWRASVFWHDGPVGHTTRKTLGAIASELASDYTPVKVRVTNDAEVMKWTNTAEFADGARAVEETRRWNEGQR